MDAIIRPEHVKVEDADSVIDDTTTNVIEGKVIMSTYLGSVVRYDVQVGEYELIVDTTYSSGTNIFGVKKEHKATFEVNTRNGSHSNKLPVKKEYLFDADIL